MLDTVKKIGNIYNKAEEYVLVGSLVVTVAIIFYQVIMRFVFNDSPSWSEEITRYIFIWQIWLGASMGLKDGSHIRVELINNAFVKKNKLKSKNTLELFILVVWLIFSIFLVFAGVSVCEGMSARNALSPGIRIPLIYVYMAVPVSSAIVSLRLVGLIAGEASKLIKGGAA